MTALYEAMFLLDNQVVRQDWSKAKAVVTDLLEKHGATVKSARRWDERRLAYPIKKRNRATFLLTYTEIPVDGIAPLRRDLELSENVLRYLFLSTDEVPAEELELTSAEGTDEFVVPLPPEDHELDVVEEESKDGDKAESNDREKATDGDAPKAEGEAAATEETKTEESAAEETKAEEPKVEEAKTEEPAAEEAKTEEPKAEEAAAETEDTTKKDEA